MNQEEFNKQIIEALAGVLPDAADVSSVEENCGTVNIEMMNGDCYAVSVFKTEPEE